MPKSKIIILKSPLVSAGITSDSTAIYANQVTYSVRLSNGMIVSRPEEFPSDNAIEIANLPQPGQELDETAG